MKAILDKEQRGYFRSPIGYIFTGVFFALCAMFFVSGTLYYQSADLKSVFSNVNILYLFLVSMLTMGLFAPERSRKTDQLLLTAPVSVTQIVLGKFFAALSVFGITLVLSLIFPIIISVFGNPSISEIIGAYIGFILLWGTFIAIGMFISALTESQMIAAVVSFGVLLLVYFMGWFASNISNEFMQKLLKWLSIMDRYEDFQNGILKLENIVYYLSIIGIFVILTIQVIRRRQYGEKPFRINNTVVTAAAVAGILLFNGVVNVITAKLPLQIDLTHDSVYKFSDQTKEVLSKVDSELNIYAIYPDSTTGEIVDTIKEHLKQYQQMNKNIKVTYIDPYSDPAFARKYGEDAGVGSIIVEKGDRFKVVKLNQLYRQSQATGEVSVDTEKQITGAVSYVLGSAAPLKAYFTDGHNEYSSAELKKVLESEGYEVGTIRLGSEEIPQDASVVICMAPSADFSAEERDALDAYLMNGGKAGFIFTAGNRDTARLDDYLGEWGLKPDNDYVIESDSSMALRSSYGVPVPSPQMQKHSITDKLIEQKIAFMAPDSCSFTVNDNNIQHTFVTPLLTTSDKSWGITDMTRTDTSKKEGDINGPLTVAAISEKSGDGNTGAIFVLGSLSSAETSGILSSSAYSNGDFITNAFAYLTDSTDSLSIRAKVISADTMSMTEKQVRVFSIILQYILPLIILVSGLVIWLRRRYL